MILAIELFCEQDIHCSNKAQNRVLALNLRISLLVELIWEDKIKCLEEAHDEVRIWQRGILLDLLVQELKCAIKALGPG